MKEHVARPQAMRRPAPKAGGVLAVRANLAPVVDRDAVREREADHAASALGGAVAAQAAPAGGADRLDRPTQAFFGQRLRHDFSGVRVHAAGRAAGRGGGWGASAFTVGNAVYFGRGGYQPHRPEGSRLLAHELTHVAQQSRLGRAAIQRKLIASGDTAGLAAAA